MAHEGGSVEKIVFPKPDKPSQVNEGFLNRWFGANCPMAEWPTARTNLTGFLNHYLHWRSYQEMGAFEETIVHTLAEAADSDTPNIAKVKAAWESLRQQ